MEAPKFKGRVYLEFAYDSAQKVFTFQLGRAGGLEPQDLVIPNAEGHVTFVLRSEDQGWSFGESISKLVGSGPTPASKTATLRMDAKAAFEEGGKWRLHIELFANDASRRLELVGCLSFSLEELTTTVANGWYYLLEKAAGAQTHMAVPPARIPLPPTVLKHPEGAQAAGACVLNTDAPVWAAAAWGFEVDENVFASLPRHERNRQQAIFELILSELQYITDLSLVVDAYSARREENTMTTAEFAEFILPLKDIRALHEPFMDALRTRQETSANGLVERVGDLVLEHIGRLENLYSTYCESNVMIGRKIEAKLASNAAFSAFSESCKTEMGSSLDLLSYRLKPMQRLTRYPLLIGVIEKHTPMQHGDRMHLSRALGECVTMISTINERIKASQLKQELTELRDSLVVTPRFRDFSLKSPTLELRRSAVFQRVKLRKTPLPELKVPADLKSNARSDGRKRLFLLVDHGSEPFLLLTQPGAGASPQELLLAPPIPLATVKFLPHEKFPDTQATTDLILEIATPWDVRSRHVIALRGVSTAMKNEWLREMREMQSSVGPPAASQPGVDELLKIAGELRRRSRPLSELEGQLVNAASIIEGLLLERKRMQPSPPREIVVDGQLRGARKASTMSHGSGASESFSLGAGPSASDVSLLMQSSRVPSELDFDSLLALPEHGTAPTPRDRILHYFAAFCKCRKTTDAAATAERSALDYMCAALDDLQQAYGSNLRAFVEETCWPRMAADPCNSFPSFTDMWSEVTEYWYLQAQDGPRQQLDSQTLTLLGEDADATYI
eukprot:m.67061 g.67061  ORF g.67061 m.67061 type:complete len:789 (-) comp12682_c0_seq5:46-2412(-)